MFRCILTKPMEFPSLKSKSILNLLNVLDVLRSLSNIECKISRMSTRLWDASGFQELKPAKNVGSNNAAVIEKLISEAEGQNFPKVAEFETQVISYKSKESLSKPDGIKEPEKIYTQVTNYSRDPKVKAWVLKEAAGICESCGSDAPFTTAEGEPFLEVHHLRRLADGV